MVNSLENLVKEAGRDGRKMKKNKEATYGKTVSKEPGKSSHKNGCSSTSDGG